MRTLVLVLLVAAGGARADNWTFWTLAGSDKGGGALDGPAAEARFSSPSAVAVCADAVFVADMGNHAIRRVSRDGQVTTWAGALEDPGSADGSREAARFRNPAGLDADAQCNLYVADRGNHSIRRISAAGQVTTVAGLGGTPGLADGAGSEARFNKPEDVAVDTDGSIWVADTGNARVRRIGTDGRVTTMSRVFGLVYGVTVDGAGNVYASDLTNNVVVRIARNGSASPFINGTSLFPSDVAFDASGRMYIANYFDQQIQRREANGTLLAIAGTRPVSGWRDGQGVEALFDFPRGMTFDAVEGSFVVADQFGCVIRRVTPDGLVTTIAGTPAPRPAHVDGIGTAARFVVLSDFDVDTDGTAWVSDFTTIRRVGRDGATTTFAGAPGVSLFRDGNRAEARFRGLGGIAVEPSGSLVVVDGNTVRRVSRNGDVTTIAGSPAESGFRDGAGADARFDYIVSIAVAPDGTVYVADAFNRAIRRIASDSVTTLATSVSDFFPPMGGIDTDAEGNVYLWNENVPSIFRITPSGVVTKLATDTSLNTHVNGLAVAPDGTVYLGGFRYNALYRLLPGSSTIERFAGDEVAIGNQNGNESKVRFRTPSRLDVAPDGRIYVRDYNRAIRIASDRGAPPAIAAFTAASDTLPLGESVTLEWSTIGGNARIEPSVGAVDATGSITVAPTVTTTYSLIVTNEAGDVRSDVTVNITGPRRRSVRAR